MKKVGVKAAEKRKYKRVVWIGFTLGSILLFLGLDTGFGIPGTNLLLVYLMDATISSGLLAILFGAVSAVAYAAVSWLPIEKEEGDL